MSVKADLIERLKRFGAEHDYSESDLARKLKVSKGLVDAWFSGEGTPSLDAALRIRRLKHGEQQRGLWSQRDLIPPWEYRHAGKKAN